MCPGIKRRGRGRLIIVCGAPRPPARRGNKVLLTQVWHTAQAFRVGKYMFSSFVLTLPLFFSPEWYSCLFIKKRFLLIHTSLDDVHMILCLIFQTYNMFFFYLALPVQEGHEKMNGTHASLQALHPSKVHARLKNEKRRRVAGDGQD